MIKCIIFDCFGVIFSDNFDLLYTRFGGNVKADAEFIEQFFFDLSKGKSDWYGTLQERLGVTQKEWKQASDEINGFNFELLDYIKELRKKYKIGMLSNVGSDGLTNYMDYAVLEEHFDSIIESAKVGYAKPEASAYEIAAESLDVRLDECVFTDDRPNYIEGAKSVGMKTILYKDTEQFKRELQKLLKK